MRKQLNKDYAVCESGNFIDLYFAPQRNRLESVNLIITYNKTIKEFIEYQGRNAPNKVMTVFTMYCMRDTLRLT